MRKKLNLLFGLVLIISMIALIGCGGSGKTGEKNPYEGKWVAVSAQMMGMSVSIDETFGGAFEFEVKNNGKVSFSVGDTTGNGKWSVEDNQFILSIEGEEMVGIIGKDIISFDNMLEMGVKVIFAKDGTDAMDPALYLTEEENAVIGEWAAESVEELLGDGPQTSMEGVDNINDALRLDFKSDRNVNGIEDQHQDPLLFIECFFGPCHNPYDKEPVSEIEKKYQELLETLSPEQEEVITEYCNAIFSSGADTEKFFYRLGLKDGLNLKNTVKSVLEMIS